FQAEDGIRDKLVTGVQTCALPICGRERADQHRAGAALRLAYEVEAPVHAVRAVDVGVAGRTEHHAVALGAAAERMRGRIGVVVRSEERRVGKEWRSGCARVD